MKLTKVIAETLTYICALVTISFTITVLTQVITRIISYSLPGTEEISRLLIVWLTFLGTSLAIHKKMHLSVSFFVNLMNKTLQKIIYFLVNILIIIFFVILTVYGFNLTIETISNPTPILHLPTGLFYASIPISSLFSIYFTVTHMFESTGEGESAI